MKNNFNLIAPIYDVLSWMVYGKELLRAQVEYLNVIPAGAKVLIIGGGTGACLESLNKLNIPLEIIYLEASSAMIERARRRGPLENLCINYQLGTEADLRGDFDVILTFFFLDLFSESNLKKIIQALYRSLKRDGIWLMADFRNTETLWQKQLIKVMYYFFRIVSRIEANGLLDLQEYLSHQPLRLINKKLFFHGMVASHLYRKS
ncbi:class I SAM-dependent methyltransferase [Fulvivirga sediminis]|uniref:Class I SAM-dependent methyltransferase n=1 Tax=Fulvivirga sediminis TaxID=2803949 RepID=A0A937F795_9BACT|nr:class I SAM-dependent methyltransferase [Fulvivirga sediminis]MBL3657737.1 class I SAM-dependent methyltransferase [Fulvivirga sediminis]